MRALSALSAVRGAARAAVRHMSLPAFQSLQMPALSPTMTSGTIGKWLKKVGR